MKISHDTLALLKNFSSINSNLVVKEGNTLRLRGQGRTSPAGDKGDLYLQIQFVTW